MAAPGTTRPVLPSQAMFHERSIRHPLLLVTIGLLLFSAETAAAKDVNLLPTPVPAGILLPVILETTITAQKVQPGMPIRCKLAQRVPLGGKQYIPQGTKLLGRVVAAGPDSLSLAFTDLRLRKASVPVSVRLVAAASWYAVYQTELPVGGTDHSTSNPADWTTQQIGGDQVYRAAGFGGVYNSASEPVGRADLWGVYSLPGKDGLPLAMGPFSTTASGLFDLRQVELLAPGGPAHAPIALHMKKTGRWKLERQDALLLKVIG
jgi:hypothetical protein